MRRPICLVCLLAHLLPFFNVRRTSILKPKVASRCVSTGRTCSHLKEMCFGLNRPFGQTHSSERGLLCRRLPIKVIGAESLQRWAEGEDNKLGKWLRETFNIDIADRDGCRTLWMTHRLCFTLSHGVRMNAWGEKCAVARSRKCILWTRGKGHPNSPRTTIPQKAVAQEVVNCERSRACRSHWTTFLCWANMSNHASGRGEMRVCQTRI